MTLNHNIIIFSGLQILQSGVVIYVDLIHSLRNRESSRGISLLGEKQAKRRACHCADYNDNDNGY